MQRMGEGKEWGAMAKTTNIHPANSQSLSLVHIQKAVDFESEKIQVESK